MAQLAEIENEPLPNNLIHRIEIQYLEQKNPYTAAIFSFFFPGLGQVYNQRFYPAFYAMFWWWVYLTFSHAYEAAFYLFMGNNNPGYSRSSPPLAIVYAFGYRGLRLSQLCHGH
jgi:TM2 domain-containing membrane protein YozV